MANKQKRITLKTLHEMLNGISLELAEKVHLLFIANYIDYSDYEFRDENQVESYCWCYRDLFELKTKESQEIVNSQLIEFLDEWRQDAPSRYRKAKDDVCYWITDEWYNFESPMQKEIESAYQTALKKKDDLAIALALSPFAKKTAELVNSGAYEAAAGSCYAIFRCLAKTCKEHEDWFAGFTGYGDTYTKLAIFTEAVVELYCHLRQKPDLSNAWQMRWISTWKCSTSKPTSSVTCTAAPVSQTCSVMPKPNTGIILCWMSAPCGGCGGRKGENDLLDDMDLDRYDKVKCSKIEEMLPKLMVEGEEKSMR